MKYTVLFFLLIPLQLFSQKINYKNDLEAWYMVFVDAKVSNKLGIHAEAQPRNYQIISTRQQFLLRTSLDYFATENTTFSIGYGNITSSSYFMESLFLPKPEVQITKEHRIYQQILLKQKFGKVRLNHRYRLEQRWESTSLETNFSNRFRYFLEIDVPIWTAKNEIKQIFYSFYDEIFLNISDKPFSQNRFFHALGYKMSEFATFKVGYLYNFTGVNYHRLQFGVWLKPDFRKKEN